MRRAAQLTLLLLALQQEVVASAPDDVDRTAKRFYALYTAGDVAGVKALWASPSLPQELERHMRGYCSDLRGLRIAVTGLENGSASVDVDALVNRLSSVPDRSVEVIERGSLALRRVGGVWRIVSWTRAETDLSERLLATDVGRWRALLDGDADLQNPVLIDEMTRLAVNLVNRGNRDLALALAAESRLIAKRLGDDGAMAAVLSVEAILLRLDGRVTDSVSAGRQAVALADRNGDGNLIGRCLLRLARAEELELPGSEVWSLRRIIEMSPRIDDPTVLAHASTMLAKYYGNRRERGQSLHYALRASRFAEQSGDAASRIGAHLNAAGLFLDQGDLELAKAHYRQVQALAGEAGFPSMVASALEGLADIENRAGRPREAIAAVDLALAIRGCDEPIISQIELRLLRTMAFIALGDLRSAEADARDCIAFSQSVSEDRLLQGSLCALARIRVQQGQFDQAISLLRSGVAGGSLQMRQELGRTLLLAGRLTEAAPILRSVIDEIESDRRSLIGDSRQRELFLSTRLEPYGELTELLMKQGDAEGALEIAERMRARVLQDLLGGAVTRQSAEAARPSEVQHVEERIRELNRASLMAKGKASHVLRSRLAGLRLSLAELSSREGVSSTAARAQTADLVIPPGAVVLEYLVRPEKTLVFALSRDRDGATRVQLVVISISAAQLREAVSDLVERIGHRDLLYRRAGRRLYDILLAPVHRSVSTARVLCIIPDDSLWNVPFQALIRPDGDYVADHTAVFEAPSLSVLAHVAKRARGAARSHPRLLAFANPVVNATVAARYHETFRSASMEALPEAEQEVKSIARLYGSDRSVVHIGEAALESSLKSEAPGFDVLHIATHGFADAQDPMFSSLLFAAADGDSDQDGLLEARELASLKLHSSLAVLSACDTALGQVRSGEGQIGLSWAFLAAGCPTTVVSQWRAESAATARLMVAFHRDLLNGASPAEAMRRAQQIVRSDSRYRHPLYWAPFVVVGAGW
ncbi:MAG: CHAT domain-containing protein [Acidobacteriota bacterium]